MCMSVDAPPMPAIPPLPEIVERDGPEERKQISEAKASEEKRRRVQKGHDSTILASGNEPAQVGKPTLLGS